MTIGEIKRIGVQMSGMVYENNKTGKQYMVIGAGMNATNKDDGKTMIMYKKFKDGTFFGITFLRERSEFIQKFTRIESTD